MCVAMLDSSCTSGRPCVSELKLEPFFSRSGLLAGFECPVAGWKDDSHPRVSNDLTPNILNKILRFAYCARFPQCHNPRSSFDETLAVFLQIGTESILNPDHRSSFKCAALVLASRGVQLGLTLSASDFEKYRGQVRKLKSAMYLLADSGVQFMISYEPRGAGWSEDSVASYLEPLSSYARFGPEWFGLGESKELSDLGLYKKSLEALRRRIHSRDMVFFCSGVHSSWQRETTFSMPFTFFSGDALAANSGWSTSSAAMST